VVEILLVLQQCDLSSSWTVQRVVDFVLEKAASISFENVVDSDNDDNNSDYWSKRFLDAVKNIGKKCSKVLQVEVALSDRVMQEASLQRIDQHNILRTVSQALLRDVEFSNGTKSDDTAKAVSDKPSLFFLKGLSSEVSRRPNVSSQAISSMEILRSAPADGNIAVYLKAIRRIRTAFTADYIDVSFVAADVLVRLRQHVQSFPDASSTPAPPAHKYVSMSAMLSTSPSVSSGHTNSSTGSRDQKDEQAFASLHIPIDLEKSCQEMVDLTSDVYVKVFALNALPRIELLQLMMLGRVGLVLAFLQNSTDSLLIIEKLRWVAKEATRLRFLVDENQREGDMWLSTQLLSDVSSLNDLKRAFVSIVRKAWPTALIEAAISRCTPATSESGVHSRRLAIAHANIVEPITSPTTKAESREITANWPFKQRVRFSVTNVRDISQIYVKSVLPNGDVTHHHVPATCIRNQGPRKNTIDHVITLTVSPFSDPTAFTVSVCLGHPMLPGSVKQNTPGAREMSPRMFTAISSAVRVPIFHRSSSTLRQTAAKSSTT
ncbi:hypothetical protein PHMEG_00033211, partial [Phytophthora megakarya]